jgi:quercetin dioxygenase-like cupin family protein
MIDRPDNIQSAEVCVPSTDLTADLAFYTEVLGFRLDAIFPADDPAVATLSGHGVRLRLERGFPGPAGMLRLLCRNPGGLAGGRRELTAPNGARILLIDADQPIERPPTAHAFLVRRLKDNTPWVIGRAGMAYRDLIPGRLGGSIIASHIRIPDAGPVPDMVHYHAVGFQLIFCYSGWVRLVYEDQGPPFVLGAGDCVIQPPRIRHRVLEASEHLQVIEIGVPAEHVTTVDHEMTLPTPTVNRARRFDGQVFCHSLAREAQWAPWRIEGFEARDTGIGAATGGVASVQVVRPTGASLGPVTSHSSDVLFDFVLAGSVTLTGDGQGAHPLSEGDAFVTPPHLPTSLSAASSDLEFLEVSLPAAFETRVHLDVPLTQSA